MIIVSMLVCIAYSLSIAPDSGLHPLVFCILHVFIYFSMLSHWSYLKNKRMLGNKIVSQSAQFSLFAVSFVGGIFFVFKGIAAEEFQFTLIPNFTALIILPFFWYFTWRLVESDAVLSKVVEIIGITFSGFKFDEMLFGRMQNVLYGFLFYGAIVLGVLSLLLKHKIE